SRKLNTLIGDSWNVGDLTNIWFVDPLPPAGTYSGPRTKYHLMSINGHFSHYDSIPADLGAAGTLAADQLLEPTAASDQAAYFRNGNSGSLLYSVGCHSGLNVVNSAISGGGLALYSADFPQ